ncbi:MAG TPA: hypothetical protein VGJ84_07390 [Polyangiaceae bacterium]|jgi:hypothetical protein
MKIREFLTRYVEGYLFKDLDSMAQCQLPSGSKEGAVGYPMVMTAFAGIVQEGAQLEAAYGVEIAQIRKRFPVRADGAIWL